MDMNSNSMPPKPQNGRNILLILIVLIIILAVIFIAWKVMSKPTTITAPGEVASLHTTNTASSTAQVNGTSTESVLEKTVTVSLTDSEYSPRSVTINVGDTVKFVNDSNGKMWTASGPHPYHTDYKGFDEKTAVNNGGTYSFQFLRAGHWSYHNHLNPAQNGTVVVNENGSNKD